MTILKHCTVGQTQYVKIVMCLNTNQLKVVFELQVIDFFLSIILIGLALPPELKNLNSTNKKQKSISFLKLQVFMLFHSPDLKKTVVCCRFLKSEIFRELGVGKPAMAACSVSTGEAKSWWGKLVPRQFFKKKYIFGLATGGDNLNVLEILYLMHCSKANVILVWIFQDNILAPPWAPDRLYCSAPASSDQP